jgi:hypothetical protein
MSKQISTLLGLIIAARLSAVEMRPANELTEVWEPIPVLVATPIGKPPSDAIVLFDGTNLDAWEPVRSGEASWKIEDNSMVIVPKSNPCDMRTKQNFGDVQLHLEWRAPAGAKGNGQDRGNSGVFFMGFYEIQILDSWDNPTYINGQAASVYKEHAPLVNASRHPGEWQVYDVVFIAPRFSPEGKLISAARLTAFHNGILVQYDVALTGPTPNGASFHQPTLPPYEAHAAKLPLQLQDHRHPVAFRNIWVRELDLPNRNDHKLTE